MTLRIDRALSEGYDRLLTRPGAVLVGAFVAVGLLNLVVSQSFLQALTAAVEPLLTESGRTSPFAGAERGRLAFAVGLSLPVATLLSVATALLLEAVRVVAIRVFAGEATDRFPRQAARRRLGVATLTAFVAGVVASLLTGLGLIFLVVPGLYVALSLLFVRQEVAVADKGLVAALRGSWALAAGDRWELLGLAVVLLVVSLLGGLPAFVVQFVGLFAVASLLSVLVGAVTTVFTIAVLTRAYVQLREAEPDEAGHQVEGDGEEWSDDDEDWDDPPGV
ncbi:MAG: hypothetical protein ABEJ30_00040 [Halorientalis sp.]